MCIETDTNGTKSLLKTFASWQVFMSILEVIVLIGDRSMVLFPDSL